MTSAAMIESSDPREVLSVADLTQRIRGVLQGQFRDLWVAGEVSDLARPQSGHVYFTLKDEDSQIAAILWKSTVARMRVPLVDGMHVICRAGLDIYPPRGSYQLIVRQVEVLGEGALQRALRQLQARLAAEGLFSVERKRPLPRFPSRIAIVTSPTGAALRDFLEVARRRWRGPELLIVPTRVQGEGAADEIRRALDAANGMIPPPDLIVLTRGGGSMEDLWCFNDEALVRALFHSRAPVVSAVGHEIDVTLSDLVADRRALTPSEAAELAIPSAEELSQYVWQVASRLKLLMQTQLDRRRQRLLSLSQQRALARPWDRLRELAKRLDELDERFRRALWNRLGMARATVQGVEGRLQALNPMAVLQRGYQMSVRADSQQIVASYRDVAAGDRMVTFLADGRIVSVVQESSGTDNTQAELQHGQIQANERPARGPDF